MVSFHFSPLFTVMVTCALVAGPFIDAANAASVLQRHGLRDVSRSAGASRNDHVNGNVQAHHRRSSQCKISNAQAASSDDDSVSTTNSTSSSLSDTSASTDSSSAPVSSSTTVDSPSQAVDKSKKHHKSNKANKARGQIKGNAWAANLTVHDVKTASQSSSSGVGRKATTTTKSSAASNGTSTSVKAELGEYSLVKSNRGNTFFDGTWDFWTQADPTHGNVQFLSEVDATSSNLIGINNGTAFMRASSQDIASGANRPSVRFQSKTAYDSGLVIFDVQKMPVGCGTWPALWTTQGAVWPNGGEIDVVEGTGFNSTRGANQMTVHIGQNSPLATTDSLGTVLSSDCNQYGAQTGCAYLDSNGNGPSWGTEFNDVGGGVWAMEFGSGNGVTVWFWGRESGSIPDELSNPATSPSTLSPDNWGTPMANFSASALDQVIAKQNIIMDITIGGDWAGNVPLDGDCGSSLADALQVGSNYADAEFIINGIDVYCNNAACSGSASSKRRALPFYS